MVRRIAQESRTGQVMLPPGLAAAPVLDLMCTHFVLTLTQQQGAQFNLKRDLSGLLPLPSDEAMAAEVAGQAAWKARVMAPGRARAAAMAMPVTAAWAWGERTKTACARLGKDRSSR